MEISPKEKELIRLRSGSHGAKFRNVLTRLANEPTIIIGRIIVKHT